MRTLLFTNTVYFHIPVNFRIFKFRTLLYENFYSTKFSRITVVYSIDYIKSLNHVVVVVIYYMYRLSAPVGGVQYGIIRRYGLYECH